MPLSALPRCFLLSLCCRRIDDAPTGELCTGTAGDRRHACSGGVLSRVAVCCRVRRCALLRIHRMQHICPGCHKWKTAAHMHGKQCRDCYDRASASVISSAAASLPASLLPSASIHVRTTVWLHRPADNRRTCSHRRAAWSGMDGAEHRTGVALQ
jgi:hypothetical protein